MAGEFEDAWRDRFAEFAELRDDDAGIAGWSETGLAARVRRFAGLWKAGPPGARWLDAGCGAGTYARFLAGHGCNVIGADYSLPSLQKTAARNTGVALVVADVRRLPFARESFDGALCFGVTQALADSAPALRELAAQVRAGGELWVDALNRTCVVHVAGRFARWVRRRPVHLRYESPRRLVHLLRAEGIDDIRLHWMPIAPGRSPALQRWLEAPAGRWLLAHAWPLGPLLSHAFLLEARKRRD